MDTPIDLKAYFNRIGFAQDAHADLATLKALQLLHVQHIPFENLNPLVKVPVHLDFKSLQDKLVKNQRGGYCFEQNLLFYRVLKTIGFAVTPLAARVLWNAPADKITAKTHMLLHVKIAGIDYIVDVGFGGQSLTGPLKFEMDIPQKTPHEDYRIVKKGKHFLAQVSIQNTWKNMYRFTLAPQHFIDYQVANWYTSTHPDSHFTKSLTVARAGKTCRYVLNNQTFKVHRMNGESEQETLNTVKAIKKVLVDVFHLSLPRTKDFEVLLNRLCAEGNLK